MSNGVPENVNPFCIVDDLTVDDALVVSVFPEYFDYGKDGLVVTKESAAVPALSQLDAQLLVGKIYQVIALIGEVAVKETYKDIIPEDLKALVPVTRSDKGRCDLSECYYLEVRN